MSAAADNTTARSAPEASGTGSAAGVAGISKPGGKTTEAAYDAAARTEESGSGAWSDDDYSSDEFYDASSAEGAGRERERERAAPESSHDLGGQDKESEARPAETSRVAPAGVEDHRDARAEEAEASDARVDARAERDDTATQEPPLRMKPLPPATKERLERLSRPRTVSKPQDKFSHAPHISPRVPSSHASPRGQAQRALSDAIEWAAKRRARLRRAQEIKTERFHTDVSCGLVSPPKDHTPSNTATRSSATGSASPVALTRIPAPEVGSEVLFLETGTAWHGQRSHRKPVRNCCEHGFAGSHHEHIGAVVGRRGCCRHCGQELLQLYGPIEGWAGDADGSPAAIRGLSPSKRGEFGENGWSSRRVQESATQTPVLQPSSIAIDYVGEGESPGVTGRTQEQLLAPNAFEQQSSHSSLRSRRTHASSVHSRGSASARARAHQLHTILTYTNEMMLAPTRPTTEPTNSSGGRSSTQAALATQQPGGRHGQRLASSRTLEYEDTVPELTESRRSGTNRTWGSPPSRRAGRVSGSPPGPSTSHLPREERGGGGVAEYDIVRGSRGRKREPKNPLGVGRQRLRDRTSPIRTSPSGSSPPTRGASPRYESADGVEDNGSGTLDADSLQQNGVGHTELPALDPKLRRPYTVATEGRYVQTPANIFQYPRRYRGKLNVVRVIYTGEDEPERGFSPVRPRRRARLARGRARLPKLERPLLFDVATNTDFLYATPGDAATRIQAVVRGNAARRYCQWIAAATKIQSVARGYIARDALSRARRIANARNAEIQELERALSAAASVLTEACAVQERCQVAGPHASKPATTATAKAVDVASTLHRRARIARNDAVYCTSDGEDTGAVSTTDIHPSIHDARAMIRAALRAVTANEDRSVRDARDRLKHCIDSVMLARQFIDGDSFAKTVKRQRSCSALLREAAEARERGNEDEWVVAAWTFVESVAAAETDSAEVLRVAETVARTLAAARIQRVARGRLARAAASTLRQARVAAVEETLTDIIDRVFEGTASATAAAEAAAVASVATQVLFEITEQADAGVEELAEAAAMRNAACTKIQSLVRGRAGRKAAAAIVVEVRAGRHRAASAVSIHRVARGRSARRIAASLREEAEVAATREAAAVRIQSAARGHDGRKRARLECERRRDAENREAAAVKIQAAARGWAGRQIASERRVQLEAWEAEDTAQKESAATHIQAVARGRAARMEVARMKDEEQRRADAAVKIQALARGHIGRQSAGEARTTRDNEITEQRIESAVAIQAAARGRAVRRAATERSAAAVTIQAAERGRQGRNIASARRTLVDEADQSRTAAAIQIQSAARGRAGRRDAARRRDERDEDAARAAARSNDAAVRIQAPLRGHLARNTVRSRRMTAAEAKAATTIQAVWRGHQGRLLAARESERYATTSVPMLRTALEELGDSCESLCDGVIHVDRPGVLKEDEKLKTVDIRARKVVDRIAFDIAAAGRICAASSHMARVCAAIGVLVTELSVGGPVVETELPVTTARARRILRMCTRIVAVAVAHGSSDDSGVDAAVESLDALHRLLRFEEERNATRESRPTGDGNTRALLPGEESSSEEAVDGGDIEWTSGRSGLNSCGTPVQHSSTKLSVVCAIHGLVCLRPDVRSAALNTGVVLSLLSVALAPVSQARQKRDESSAGRDPARLEATRAIASIGGDTSEEGWGGGGDGPERATARYVDAFLYPLVVDGDPDCPSIFVGAHEDPSGALQSWLRDRLQLHCVWLQPIRRDVAVALHREWRSLGHRMTAAVAEVGHARDVLYKYRGMRKRMRRPALESELVVNGVYVRAINSHPALVSRLPESDAAAADLAELSTRARLLVDLVNWVSAEAGSSSPTAAGNKLGHTQDRAHRTEAVFEAIANILETSPGLVSSDALLGDAGTTALLEALHPHNPRQLHLSACRTIALLYGHDRVAAVLETFEAHRLQFVPLLLLTFATSRPAQTAMLLTASVPSTVVDSDASDDSDDDESTWGPNPWTGAADTAAHATDRNPLLMVSSALCRLIARSPAVAQTVADSGAVVLLLRCLVEGVCQPVTATVEAAAAGMRACASLLSAIAASDQKGQTHAAVAAVVSPAFADALRNRPELVVQWLQEEHSAEGELPTHASGLAGDAMIAAATRRPWNAAARRLAEAFLRREGEVLEARLRGLSACKWDGRLPLWRAETVAEFGRRPVEASTTARK